MDIDLREEKEATHPPVETQNHLQALVGFSKLKLNHTDSASSSLVNHPPASGKVTESTPDEASPDYCASISSMQTLSLEEHPSATFPLTYHPPIRVNGRVRVIVPEEVTQIGISIWRNTLVGQFFGRRLRFRVFKTIAEKVWGGRGLANVLLHEGGRGYFLFKFEEYSALDKILEEEPWYFAGKPMVLQKWKPGMQFK